MKPFQMALYSALVCLSTSGFAQHGGSGSGGGGTGGSGGRSGAGTSVGNTTSTGLPSLPNLNTPSSNFPGRTLFLSGKFTVDDGTMLTDAAAIQIICHGWSHTVGYTDRKGSFSIELDPNSPANRAGVGDVTDNSASTQGQYGGYGQGQEWRDCQLQGVLPGFTSQLVDLGPRLGGGDNRADLGNIVLHRIGEVEGFTISATSAGAPSKARKDYEKGLSLEKKKDWAGAQQRFQAAVDLYPKYAVAWVKLGLMQLQQGHEEEAKQSLKQALAADSRFLLAYEKMALIAANHQQWKDLADLSDQMLRLNPINFPQYWFLNAVANYQLQNFDVAQKSAVRGIEVDAQHHFPRLEYVLGLVLTQKGDYHGALEHLRNYVRLSPKAPDVTTAQNTISQLESLEAASDRSPESK